MNDKSEFEKLLGSLQKGLRTHSVSELNKTISSAISQKVENNEIIIYTLNLVASHHQINVDKLKEKYIHGDVQDAKHISYCLLHYELGFKIRWIAKNVFQCWPNTILKGTKRLKNINPKIKTDESFLNTYNDLSERLKEYQK